MLVAGRYSAVANHVEEAASGLIWTPGDYTQTADSRLMCRKLAHAMCRLHIRFGLGSLHARCAC